MDFAHNLAPFHMLSQRFLLLLTLFFLAQSLPTLNMTDSEGKECRDITLHLINETFPATIQCSSEAEWSVQPALPKGLTAKPYKNVWSVFGFSKVHTPKTTFTVTAVTPEGEVSITFNLTCIGCEEGDMYQIDALGLIRLSYQEESIDIKYKCWQCLKRVVYTYQSLKMYSHIYMFDTDGHCVMRFEAMGNRTGELDLSGNSPPILFFPEEINVNQSTTKYVSYNFVNRVTNVTIYPPNPKFSMHTGEIWFYIETFYESNHIITVSNECGSASQVFHLSINKCFGGSYYTVTHLDKGDIYAVDSQNNTIYDGKQNYFCTSDRNMTLYFDRDYWGVELLRPVLLFDKNGIVAEYNTDSVPAAFNFYKQDLVSTFSTLRISHSFVTNWNSKNFDDSLWKEDRGQLWGSYHGDGAYFRKEFTIDSIDNLNTMLIDVLAMGDVDVYLNGEYVNHVFGKSYTTFTRLEVPLRESHIGKNVFAAYLRKSEEDIINFDIMIQLTFAYQRLQSMLGEVTQETATPSPDPLDAFRQTGYYHWTLQSVPSSLIFRFNDTEKRIVNRVYFQVPEDNFLTKVEVAAIDIKGNKNLTLYSSPSDFMNRFMNYRIVDFDNSVAYGAYRITFVSVSNASSTKIENLRLYRDMLPTCPQTKRYPETRGNKMLLSNCGLFYTGKKQDRCVIDGSQTHWEEDRSTCLSLLPTRNHAYVDFTLRLIHVIPSMFNSTMKDQLLFLLVEKTAVRPEEVEIIYVTDSSDSENSSIDIYIRITVKQAGGDYIAEQLSDLKKYLSDPIHTYIAEELDGMIVGRIRVYLSWKPEIIILIIVLLLVLLILVIFAIYGMSAYIRDRKLKTKSLKHRLLNEDETLIDHEFIVCINSQQTRRKAGVRNEQKRVIRFYLNTIIIVAPVHSIIGSFDKYTNPFSLSEMPQHWLLNQTFYHKR